MASLPTSGMNLPNTISNTLAYQPPTTGFQMPQIGGASETSILNNLSSGQPPSNLGFGVNQLQSQEQQLQELLNTSGGAPPDL